MGRRDKGVHIPLGRLATNAGYARDCLSYYDALVARSGFFACRARLRIGMRRGRVDNHFGQSYGEIRVESVQHVPDHTRGGNVELDT